MNVKNFLKNLKPDPSKMTGSYQDSLIHVTKLGTIFAAIFFLAFAIIYGFGGYPPMAVWVNLIATLCALSGYVLITRFKQHRPTAHLVTFAIYISSAGVMVISGGVHSSCSPEQTGPCTVPNKREETELSFGMSVIYKQLKQTFIVCNDEIMILYYHP